MQLTYQKLNNLAMIQAVQKLAQHPFPIKTAYQLKKMADALIRAREKTIAEFRKDILDQHVQRDEKGEYVYGILPNGKPDLSDPIIDNAKKDDFLKAQEAFGNKTFDLGRNKLPLADLDGRIELSAAELSALDPLLDDPEPETATLETPAESTSP